jgi:hypothetical protein
MATYRPAALLLLALSSAVISFPTVGELGSEIKFPPPLDFTGGKVIPDADHPYIAPGPNDLRGPCPGLNTMANHGYLPRNGVASVEQLITGAQEAFNLGYNFSRAVSSFAILTRGNALLDRVSIGGESPLVPPLPNRIDGTPGGLSRHGRFEGDVSMTRQNAALAEGDGASFQPAMFKDLLGYVDKFGDGDIVTQSVINEYRFARFADSVKRDPNLTYHAGRWGFSYGEGGFILNLFPDGVLGKLTRGVMTSFLQNETFPTGWHRRNASFEFSDVVKVAGSIISAHPVAPGEKNASGVYVADTDPNLTGPCALYYNLVGQNVPGILVNTTGLLKKNVDTLLLEGIHPLFADSCPKPQIPFGPAGV